jgi:hypothetical protein
MNIKNSGTVRLFGCICLCLCLTLSASHSMAQSASTTYAVTTFHKVAQADVAEYEKLMTENWRAVHQLRKQNGKINRWALYRIRFSGASDEYNYASVSYYGSFEKTEPNDIYPDLMKASNPKSDAAAILAQTTKVRTIQRQVIYRLEDNTTSSATSKPEKYVMVNFMQPKIGMNADYVKIEKEDFKPVHQARVNAGSMVGWVLYTLIHPWGTSNNHQYVTGDVYSSYEQIAGDMEPVWKKLNPGKDIQPVYDRLGKARDMVKTELWELVTATN